MLFTDDDSVRLRVRERGRPVRSIVQKIDAFTSTWDFSMNSRTAWVPEAISPRPTS